MDENQAFRKIINSIVAKQAEGNTKLVDSCMEAFYSDVHLFGDDRANLTCINDPCTGSPVLEWRPPKDWYKVHKRVLETLEDITGMKATWNRCMSCPVRLSAAAPKDDHLSVLAEAIVRNYIGDKVQVEHIEPLVLAVVTMLSYFTQTKEESAIGTCCECLNLFNPPRFHRPQMIIPTPDAASNEVNF